MAIAAWISRQEIRGVAPCGLAAGRINIWAWLTTNKCCPVDPDDPDPVSMLMPTCMHAYMYGSMTVMCSFGH